MTLFEACEAAARADNAWSDELIRAKIDRWHPWSTGKPGSTLRALYDAKRNADHAVHEAFAASRAHV